MRSPPFRCLFCLRTDVSFARLEHPIPQSLGNDDTVLPRGFVCDICNQHFGSKIERVAVSALPFGIERVAASVRTKHGKLPVFTNDPRIAFHSTDFLDRVMCVAQPDYLVDPRVPVFGRYFSPVRADESLAILRLLLKIGLELLAISDADLDPYLNVFDAARRFARFAPSGMSWDLGYALWPDRSSLLLSTRRDELGPLVTHQLYQYEMGQLFSRDIAFCFAYRTHIFSCNLSAPSLIEYQSGFNSRNKVKVMRWTFTA